MTEQLGTRDVVEQLSSRLGNVEEGLRDLRQEVRGGLDAAAAERNAGFAQMHAQLSSHLRWMAGTLMLSWLSLMVSIWLKG